MQWNWQNIPSSEHGTLLAHYEAGRWSEVAKMCEQHQVSHYCCCNAQGLQNWVRWAVETGVIYDERKATAMALHNG